ncbi:MAG: arylsulfatase [Fuerstiella sp.]
MNLAQAAVAIAIFGLTQIQAATPAGVGDSQRVSTRPNIVVILADDMGYGDVQALNSSSKIPTPNLNQLAKSGLSFTDAHSPSAVCTPTRYGLLTGRYCWRSRLKKGVLGGYSEPLLEPSQATIPSMLKKHGYQTSCVGKWHLGMKLPYKPDAKADESWAGDPGIHFEGTITDSPIHHGFDRYFGVCASLDMPPYVYIRNDRFASVPTLQQPAVKFPHFVREGPRSADFVIEDCLDKLTGEAIAEIRRMDQQAEPWFLYMPLTGPHKPTQPHQRFRGKTGLNEYGDFVHQVDWTVGQVLNAVKQGKHSDNTLVIFTSDNGSYMRKLSDDQTGHVEDPQVQGYLQQDHQANLHWRGTKADVWEAGHRVPFFVSWPSQIEAAGSRSSTITHTDIYATLADAASASESLSPNEAEDSLSIVPMFSDAGATRSVPVINHSASGMFALRSGPWKLVAGNGSGGREQPRGKPFEKPFQLFHLEDDPSEVRDVASQHADVVEDLTKQLESLMKNSGRSRK